jgi:hypothetical protein
MPHASQVGTRMKVYTQKYGVVKNPFTKLAYALTTLHYYSIESCDILITNIKNPLIASKE